MNSQDVRAESISLIYSYLVMAERLMPEDVPRYLAYLDASDDSELVRQLIASKYLLKHYYQTRVPLN